MEISFCFIFVCFFATLFEISEVALNCLQMFSKSLAIILELPVQGFFSKLCTRCLKFIGVDLNFFHAVLS